MGNATANVLVDHTATIWCFQYSIDGVLDRFNEPSLKFWISFSVVERCRFIP
jgi:hypothetical protein